MEQRTPLTTSPNKKNRNEKKEPRKIAKTKSEVEVNECEKCTQNPDQCHPCSNKDKVAQAIDTCLICIDATDEILTVNICTNRHYMHRSCLNFWIQKQGLKANCPLCRAPLNEILFQNLPFNLADREQEVAAEIEDLILLRFLFLLYFCGAIAQFPVIEDNETGQQ